MTDFNHGTRFDSKRQDWPTPQDFFDRLNDEFQFTIDLAASEENKKCERFFSAEDDALNQEWEGICWINPPYGGQKENKLANWVKKAHESGKQPGTTVVMLVPARTNTQWWHKYCMDAVEVKLVQGRPKFGDCDHGLPQPLALVVFRQYEGPVRFTTFKA